jgi:hypothetical protein
MRTPPGCLTVHCSGLGITDFACSALIALAGSSEEIDAAVQEAGFKLVLRPDGSTGIQILQMFNVVIR